MYILRSLRGLLTERISLLAHTHERVQYVQYVRYGRAAGQPQILSLHRTITRNRVEIVLLSLSVATLHLVVRKNKERHKNFE